MIGGLRALTCVISSQTYVDNSQTRRGHYPPVVLLGQGLNQRTGQAGWLDVAQRGIKPFPLCGGLLGLVQIDQQHQGDEECADAVFEECENSCPCRGIGRPRGDCIGDGCGRRRIAAQIQCARPVQHGVLRVVLPVRIVKGTSNLPEVKRLCQEIRRKRAEETAVRTLERYTR